MRKKIQHIIVVITLSSSATYAQVGIGNADPHEGAILDLNNDDNKGLALPIITKPSSDTLGMLYFDKADSIVMYNDGGLNYNGLSPWKFKYGVPPIASNDVYYDEDGNVGIGVTDPKFKLSIDGGTEADTMGNNGFVLIGDHAGYQLVIDDDEIMVKSDPNTMKNSTLKLQEGGGTVQVGDMTIAPYTVNEFRTNLNVVGEVQQHGFALVPKGGIIMWTGATAPSGWALCNGQPITYLDGSTGTAPDLRERFIVGAGGENTTNPVTGTGYTAGNRGGSNTSEHKHAVDPPSAPSNPAGSHTHTGTTGGPSGTMNRCACVSGAVGDGSHTHNFTTGSSGAHTHSTDIDPFESGGATNTENRPPYYALAFIIKL